MLYSPRLYLRDWWVRVPLFLTLLLQITMWWYVLSRVRPTEDQIFLHYNVIFGVDLVGKWRELLYLPGIAFGVAVMNYLFSLFLYNQDRALSRAISFFTPLLETLALVAIFLIVRINI